MSFNLTQENKLKLQQNFENKFAAKEDEMHLREQAFHLLEKLCPSLTPSILKHRQAYLVDTYLFHKYMLFQKQVTNAKIQPIKIKIGGFISPSQNSAAYIV